MREWSVRSSFRIEVVENRIGEAGGVADEFSPSVAENNRQRKVGRRT